MYFDSIKYNIKTTKWQKKGGIIIPGEHGNGPVPPKLRGFAIFIPYSDIQGKRISKKEIKKEVGLYYYQDTFSMASKLDIIFEIKNYDSKEQQVGIFMRLLKTSLSKHKKEKILELIIDSDRFFFFENQILNTAKLGLLYGRENKKNAKPLEEDYTQKVIWGITDHLENKGHKRENLAQKKISVLETIIRNSYFNNKESYIFLTVRYWKLFFLKLVRQKKLLKSKNFINLDNEFKEATKFNLILYFSVGFSILAYYYNINLDKGKFNPNYFTINRDKIFKKTNTNRKEALKVLDHLSFTREEFKKGFNKNLLEDNDFFYNFTFFRKKPILKINENLHLPAGLRFLKEKISGGVFWDIADSLTEKKRLKFFRFFGEIFEEYINDIFRRVYCKKSILNKRCFFEKEYTKESKRTSDVMLLYGEEAIFIETNASRLRIDAAISGDIEEVKKDFNKIIFESAKQLNRVINDFRNDEFNLAGVGHKYIKKIYPLIITINPIPQLDLIWQELINPGLKNRNLLQGTDIGPLQIISAEELEFLETILTKKSLLDILKEKTDSNLRYLPMKSFLYFKKLMSRENKYMKKEFHKITNKIGKNLFYNS